MKNCILFIVLSLFGCGIPTMVYLEPPIAGDTGNLQGIYVASFIHNTDNSLSNLKGYELYYKFYAQNYKSVMETEIEQIESTTGQENNYLVSKNFLKLKFTLDDSNYTNILEVSEDNKDDVIEFFVSMDEYWDTSKEDLTSYVKSSKNDVVIDEYEMYRYVLQNREESNVATEAFRGFKKDSFYVTDGDIPDAFDEGDILYMALFVVATGWGDDYVSIHSDPTSLGMFEFSIDILQEE